MTTTEPESVREAVEADVRRRMHSVTKARGYDSQRYRDADIAEIDTLLDLWLELKE